MTRSHQIRDLDCMAALWITGYEQAVMIYCPSTFGRVWSFHHLQISLFPDTCLEMSTQAVKGKLIVGRRKFVPSLTPLTNQKVTQLLQISFQVFNAIDVVNEAVKLCRVKCFLANRLQLCCKPSIWFQFSYPRYASNRITSRYCMETNQHFTLVTEFVCHLRDRYVLLFCVHPDFCSCLPLVCIVQRQNQDICVITQDCNRFLDLKHALIYLYK